MASFLYRDAIYNLTVRDEASLVGVNHSNVFLQRETFVKYPEKMVQARDNMTYPLDITYFKSLVPSRTHLRFYFPFNPHFTPETIGAL